MLCLQEKERKKDTEEEAYKGKSNKNKIHVISLEAGTLGMGTQIAY